MYFADIIQPLTDVDFTLTTLFSFTSSPSPYYRIAAVVVIIIIAVWGSIIIVVSITRIRSVDTRTRAIVVDTSVIITITAVADACISTRITGNVVVIGWRRRRR